MRRFSRIAFCLFTALLLASFATAQQDVITTAIGGGPNQIPAIDADIYLPISVAFDGSGNYYIAAFYQNRVFKVDTTGTITVVAGIGIAGFGGDGVAGGATQAMLNGPAGVAIDGAGNIYISDYNNFVIRKVDATNTITTIAGQPGSCGYNGDGKPATNFSLCHPYGLALDSLGNLFIGDGGNCRVRKLVLATKTIATSAGTCQPMRLCTGSAWM